MPPEEPNPNKIAAELFANLLKDAAKPVAAGVRDVLTRTIDFFRLNIDQYVNSSVLRCSQVKTLLINREKPASLFDLYVHTFLTCQKETVADDELIALLPKLKSVVVEGTGGAGKSMFMRYLYLALCERPGGKIPLFVELRQLNNVQQKDLFNFILYSIVNPGSTITAEQLDRGLRAGGFTLILDGFDEIDFDQREGLAAQILDFRLKYPELVIIISSRPDPDARFESWAQFHVYRINPMTEPQVRELIGNLDYDKETKKRFLGKLRELYQKHESFLSLPLLCIIMLITFDTSADIPEKQHIFFEHGFDALFFRHDASKQGAFKRKIYSDLPIDEFRNVLSAFCMRTYTKEKFSFTLQELREFLRRSLAFEGKDQALIEPYIRDLLESVCVMQQEGIEYTFTHRSFQEYFAAHFISRSPAINFERHLDQFCKRREDTVVDMAFDMNRALLEREWILPKLTQISALASGIDIENDLVGYVNECFGGLVVHLRGATKGEFFFVPEMKPLGFVWLAIRRFYWSVFKENNLATIRRAKKEKASIVKRLGDLKKEGDPRFQGKNTQTGSLLLDRSDNEWLKSTRLYPHLKIDRELTRRLLGQVKEAVMVKQDGGELLD
jgi:predicted NACHT family NTPase